MEIKLTSPAQEAIYQQVVRQIKNQISTGKLPAGTRLPSIRQLAKQLQVNHLTVENAYHELQADGWVSSAIGRGTYVISSETSLTSHATLESGINPNALISELYRSEKGRKLRSLARSEPDIALAALDDIWGALLAQRRNMAVLGGFSPTEGDELLRCELIPLLQERGLVVDPSEIIVTSGATQALALVLQTVTQPGASILLPEPTYVGLIHSVQTLGRTIITISYDNQGDLDLNVLENLMVRYQPKALLLTPVFNNPTGHSLPEETKLKLAALMEQYQVPIIEDDVYGLISYQSPTPRPIKATSPSRTSIFYISSLSKSLMPGLRIGYVIAPPEWHQKLLTVKRATDVMGIPLIQQAVAFYLKNGAFKNHMRRVLPIYQQRRDVLLQILKTCMPPDTTWTTPSGGYSVWVKLAKPIVEQVYKAAMAQDIQFAPGRVFVTTPLENQHLRLCFGHSAVEELESIICLLANIIENVN